MPRNPDRWNQPRHHHASRRRLCEWIGLNALADRSFGIKMVHASGGWLARGLNFAAARSPTNHTNAVHRGKEKILTCVETYSLPVCAVRFDIDRPAACLEAFPCGFDLLTLSILLSNWIVRCLNGAAPLRISPLKKIRTHHLPLGPLLLKQRLPSEARIALPLFTRRG